MNNIQTFDAKIYQNNRISLVHNLTNGNVITIPNNPYSNLLEYVNDVIELGKQIQQGLQVRPPVPQWDNIIPTNFIEPRARVEPKQEIVKPTDDKEVIQLDGKTYLKIGSQVFEINQQNVQPQQQVLGTELNFNSANTGGDLVSTFHEKAAPSDFAPRHSFHKQAISDGLK